MIFDVITFGSATVDIFVKSQALSIEKNLPQDIIYIAKGSKSEIEKSKITSGGGATNASVSFSRLGFKSACTALLGQDELSAFVLNDLKNDKVSRHYLVQSPKEQTDFSVILVSGDGARTILTQRGSSRLDKNHIKWPKLKASWFYISSLEGNLDLLEHLIGYATDYHIKIALNPGSRELAYPHLKSLLPHVDFLLLNQQEAETLTNISFDDTSFWPKLKSFKSHIITVTQGRLGAHISTPTQTLFSPIITTDVVDETGAGDAFGSTFVSGLIHQKNLNACLDMALKNSASVVSHLGAKSGLLKKNKLS
jgi:ribokinase